MESSLVIVTGGCGYIGSHTISQLICKGYRVISIDNLSRSSISTVSDIHRATKLPKVQNVQIDLCDASAVSSFFETIKTPFSIIHFAAYKSVPESVLRPDIYYHNNIQSLLNILRVATNSLCNGFVFSSSCSVYGDIKSLPVTEQTPLSPPQSPYAHTKVIGESIIRDFSEAFDLNSICLRYFNPVGAHPSGLLGETPFNTASNLIPVITQTAIGLRESMTVFGGNLNTRDGTCVRDYVHVMDIADAHILALEYLFSNPKCHEIVNLGSGSGVSVLEAISMLEQIISSSINYTIGDSRPGDVVEIYSDCSKANLLFGWRPQYDLFSMLDSAWKWQLELSIR